MLQYDRVAEKMVAMGVGGVDILQVLSGCCLLNPGRELLGLLYGDGCIDQDGGRGSLNQGARNWGPPLFSRIVGAGCGGNWRGNEDINLKTHAVLFEDSQCSLGWSWMFVGYSVCPEIADSLIFERGFEAT